MLSHMTVEMENPSRSLSSLLNKRNPVRNGESVLQRRAEPIETLSNRSITCFHMNPCCFYVFEKVTQISQKKIVAFIFQKEISLCPSGLGT